MMQTTATKSRGIIFSAEMVRALLREENPKTQTRRIVKADFAIIHTEKVGIPPQVETWWCGWKTVKGDKHYLACPYGKVGDHLWVREACRAEERASDSVDGVTYLADDTFREIENTREASDAWVALNHYGKRKRGATVPPIHMPRWASRITLEITDIRVQRVQEIDQWDAYAEGISKSKSEVSNPCAAFRSLWERINGHGSWANNPWVWAISFKRVAQ